MLPRSDPAIDYSTRSATTWGRTILSSTVDEHTMSRLIYASVCTPILFAADSRLTTSRYFLNPGCVAISDGRREVGMVRVYHEPTTQAEVDFLLFLAREVLAYPLLNAHQNRTAVALLDDNSVQQSCTGTNPASRTSTRTERRLNTAIPLLKRAVAIHSKTNEMNKTSRDGQHSQRTCW